MCSDSFVFLLPWYNTMATNNLGAERVYFSSQVLAHALLLREIRVGTQSGREPKGQNWGSSHRGVLPAVKIPSLLANPAFSSYPGPHIGPRDCTTHSQEELSSSSVNQETASQACQEASLVETLSQLRFPSSRWRQSGSRWLKTS